MSSTAKASALCAFRESLFLAYFPVPEQPNKSLCGDFRRPEGGPSLGQFLFIETILTD